MPKQANTHPLTSDLPPDFLLGLLAQKVAGVWAERQGEIFRAIPPERSEALKSLNELGSEIHHGDWSAVFPNSLKG